MTINRNQGLTALSHVTTKLLVFLRGGLLVALPAGLMVAGCTSTSTIDTAFSDVGQPVVATPLDPLPAPSEPLQAPNAPSEPVSEQPLLPVPSSGAARDTGAFPNINNEPPPSQNQITDAERVAMMAEMQALQAELDAGRVPTGTSAARMAELQRLAATHSAEVLRRIEGE